MIPINDQQFWLYADTDPDTDDLLHVRLFLTTTTALTGIFLHELRQKHDGETAVFRANGAQYLQTALQPRTVQYIYIGRMHNCNRLANKLSG